MKNIKIYNFAQIKNIDVDLGDLTLLIGPQASGKSLFLQLVKLIANSGVIVKTLKREGFNWNGNIKILWNYTSAKTWDVHGRMKQK